MNKYLEKLLQAMRPAFSRRATFVWFVVILAGFMVRSDTLGVSSIIRALYLAPTCYPSLLHFFHSNAWSTETLLYCWQQWVIKQLVVYRSSERVVFLGDHTKTPKEGRRIPEVGTLYDDSETASKPSFFRGHQWACISVLICAGKKFFSTPLWAEIHRDSLEESRATRIVSMAGKTARIIGQSAYLVLDAFFATGPVFQTAKEQEGFLHILTRAKKNIVAYLPLSQQNRPGRGRPPKYGRKLKLIDLFDAWSDKFQTAHAVVYREEETVRYFTAELLWRPIKGQLLRFFLIESSRGRIILMTSDLSLEPLTALNLYCRRASIETLFHILKNTLGVMQYHFWSKYLQPASRRSPKKGTPKQISSKPEKTQNTLAAIEKFLHVQMVLLGIVQLLAVHFAPQVNNKARCWLRTPCGEIPSEFITRTALANIIRTNLFGFGKDWITQLILQKRRTIEISGKNTLYSEKDS